MLSALAAPAPGRAQQPHGFAVDVLTGVALSGYDPVAYFTEGEPRQGSSAYGMEWSGVTWYFASAANRDVFARAPEIYAPLFGGNCAMAMARGYVSQASPHLFSIVGDRLVLFYSPGNRQAFLMSPASALEAALARWETLSPPPAERLDIQ